MARRSTSRRWDTTEEWRVLLQTEAPPVAAFPASLDDAVHRIREALAGDLVVVTADAKSWRVRVNVLASSPETAIGFASDLVKRAAAQAGLPNWPVVLLEAMRADHLEP